MSGALDGTSSTDPAPAQPGATASPVDPLPAQPVASSPEPAAAQPTPPLPEAEAEAQQTPGPPPAPAPATGLGGRYREGRGAFFAGLGVVLDLSALFTIVGSGLVLLLFGAFLLSILAQVGPPGSPTLGRVALLVPGCAVWAWAACAWGRQAIRVMAVALLGAPVIANGLGREVDATLHLAALPPLALAQGALFFAYRLVLAGSLSVAPIVLLVAAPLLALLGLVLVTGATTLALRMNLPPAPALVATARWLLGRWPQLLVLLLLHAGLTLVVLALGRARPELWPWLLLWAPAQLLALAAGLVALALRWAEERRAVPAAEPHVLVASPVPSRHGPVALLLLRLSTGACLAATEVAIAVKQAEVPWAERSEGLAAGAALVVVPAVVAATLLATDRLARRAVSLDADGLLLDPGEAWPGTRIPWAEAASARVHELGVAVRVAPGTGTTSVLLPAAPHEVPALLERLERHGVRQA